MIPKKVVLLLVAWSAMVCSPPAWADLSDPGPYQAGSTTVTVTRPDGSTFNAILFYPAATAVNPRASGTFDGQDAGAALGLTTRRMASCRAGAITLDLTRTGIAVACPRPPT